MNGKKHIFLKLFVIIIFMLVTSVHISYVKGADNITYPTVPPHWVKSHYIHIWQSFGKVQGYIIFYDRDGNQCAVDWSDLKIVFRRKVLHTCRIEPKKFQKGYGVKA